ncbi:hypothetical protein HJC23_011769 [Cyclotella cryptica]|uniref:Uncharacterized protein n=1 Tax=Cyclotella cryptica TaxID=29204 RepID=A0ABD3PG35_9STRA
MLRNLSCSRYKGKPIAIRSTSLKLNRPDFVKSMYWNHLIKNRRRPDTLLYTSKPLSPPEGKR